MGYEEVFGFADEEMASFAIATLSRSQNQLDQNISRYLNTWRQRADPSIRFAYALPPPRRVLEETLAELDAEAKRRDPTILRKGVVSVSSFVVLLLDELRTLICGKGKNPTKLGPESQAMLGALAAAIARKLGISDATSVGLAVLVLITLGQATKNAFCKMSNAEVLAKLKQ
jgi:hypothetical protein